MSPGSCRWRSTSSTTPPATRPTAGAPSRRVLIVEDNADGRESLARLLQLVGHQVAVAEDGGRGVELALAVRPDVALIDLGLPDVDGCEVARQARAGLGKAVFLV